MNTIFQEPPESLDETWTHGALIGGMVGYSEEQIADSYFEAAERLIKAVLTNEVTAQEMLNPVMFLYRHGIELFLKCIVRPDIRDHNLGRLLELFCRHVRERYKETVPSSVTKPISEFIEHDPKSTVFRFESRDFATGGEIWIDLRAVRSSMLKLRYIFQRVLYADRYGEIPPRGYPRHINPWPDRFYD